MKGYLAICEDGYLGLITSDKPQAAPYSGSYQDTFHFGFLLAPPNFGFAWQSRNPKFLCRIDDKRAAAIIARYADERWITYPGHPMKVRGFVANDRLMIVESTEGDRYEHENGKWSQTAGTAAG